MMNEAIYVTSLQEVSWGMAMIGLMITIHAAGVIVTLRMGRALQRRYPVQRSFLRGIATLVAATLLLVLIHLFEVFVWGVFLAAQGAFANLSIAVYYALMQYTTVSSSLQLPQALQLIGGLIPLSGMLTIAWSTSVLFLLARPFVRWYSNDESDAPPP